MCRVASAMASNPSFSMVWLGVVSPKTKMPMSHILPSGALIIAASPRVEVIRPVFPA